MSTVREQRGRVRRAAAAAALMGALTLAGCGRPRPTTAPTAVALNVPPPPPRVISTPPEPVAPTEATTVERAVPVGRPARNSRSGNVRPEAPRPAEVTRDAPPDVAAPPPTVEPAAPAGPLLRTPQTADESVAERRTRTVLDRADELLRKLDPATLSPQARQQHETARRFIEQAGDAMLQRNFVLATYLADKAETLAKGLSR